MTKFIFFSGKGGVGKTSLASTTGVYYADLGKKTLIVTTDPAANLSDVFEQEIGHKITRINGLDNLFAMEIDPDRATEEYKEKSLAPLRDLFDEETVKVAEEQLSGPCTEEMASFDIFIDFMDEDSYDYEVVIFDTAPTGHTIRLLELPVDWSRHIEKSSEGSGQTCMGPVAMLQESKEKYDEAINKLRDPEKTEFIFVMQPEETSLYETLRSGKELKELGIETGRIIINGLIPEEEASSSFFEEKRKKQLEYVKKVEETFPGIPVEKMELFHQELKSINVFRKVAAKLFDSEKSKKDEKSFSDNIYGAHEDEKDYLENISQENLSNNERALELLLPGKKGRRNVFFSGKGGVGKTSMAVITAMKTAELGKKTLLLTTDPAAHIGEVLESEVTDEIMAVEEVPNLYAVKIDQKKATEEYKKSVLDEAREKFDETTVKTMEEELDSPCTEEMAAFQKFVEYAGEGAGFEIVVFDTAPTGHTLRLLELPGDWTKQLELKTGVETEISEKDKREQEKFEKVIEMMKDEDMTTFAFVMYPEKTPIVEAQRASKELETLGIKTRLAVCNLIIPAEQATSQFFKNRRKMQLKYLKEIENRFPDAELMTVPMLEKEIKGLETLNEALNLTFPKEVKNYG